MDSSGHTDTILIEYSLKLLERWMTFPAHLAIYSFNCELDHLSVLMFNSQLISKVNQYTHV